MTDNQVNQESRRARGEPPDSRTPHVLLIEDDDVMRDMLTEALRREGWRVSESADPIQWLQSCVPEAESPRSSQYSAADPDDYDVVVSDIRMPGMSGLDVLRVLHDIYRITTCPPTIFITAFGDEDTHRRARELGAVAVLDKPFAVKDLIDRVRMFIQT